MDQLLTLDELSKALKVPRSWIYDKTRRRGPDTIPVLRVGRYLRFSLSAVMAWLEKRQATNS
jgi:excisionase family DNA binding protein